MWNPNLSPIALVCVALFLGLVPGNDTQTRRQINLIFQIVWIALLGFACYRHIIALPILSLITVQTLACLAIKFEKNSSLLYPLFWLMIASSTASILSHDLSTALLFAFMQIAFLFFSLLQTGGLYRGSTSYESILFFLIIDLSAYFILWIHAEWIYWVILLPGLARIMFVFAAPFVRGLFYNCPTDVMIVTFSSMISIGVSLLWKIPKYCPIPDVLEISAVSSALISGMLFIVEKSRRQKGIYLFMIQGSLCVDLILNKQVVGLYLCLAALLNSVVWLYSLEYPYIRGLCTASACVMTAWLVYQ